MKKLTLILSLLISTYSFSQVMVSDFDYEYLSKNINLAVNENTTLKYGYSVLKNDEAITDDYIFQFYEVLKENKVYGFYIQQTKIKNKKKAYFFIPLGNGNAIYKMCKEKGSGGVTMAYFMDIYYNAFMLKYINQKINPEE